MYIVRPLRIPFAPRNLGAILSPLPHVVYMTKTKEKQNKHHFFLSFCSLVVNQIETTADLQQQLQSSASSHLAIVWWLLKSESSSWPNNRFDLFFLTVL